MNLLFDLVRELPLWIHLTWAAWVVAGVLLAAWHIRDRGAEQSAREQAALSRVRTKSGPRPATTIRTAPAKPPPPPHDAFGELEALLEPAAETGAASRRPGDS